MESRRQHLVEAAPLPYVLSVPPPGDDPAPVLCFLHGYDEAAPLDIREAMERHGPLRPGNPAMVGDTFIVVAPQLPRAGDLWHRYADQVREIVASVQREHVGDAARTYLTGFSFGANGVFDLSVAQTDLWAALWAVDPTRVPRAEIDQPVWLSVGGVMRRATDAFVRSMDLLPAGGGPIPDRAYLDQAADHVGSAALAYADERIYRWLLDRRRADGWPPAGGEEHGRGSGADGRPAPHRVGRR
jgi:poly(3-hydroxybutyrate) depolymerase